MSRSKRYPMCVVSKKIDEKAHRAVRKYVKQTLRTMDLNDPPIINIEGDTRSLGHEEPGTKFGFDTSGIIDEERVAEIEEDERKASRK